MPQDVFTNPNSLNITGPVVIAADNIGGAGSLKVASSLLAQDGKFGKAAAGDLMESRQAHRRTRNQGPQGSLQADEQKGAPVRPDTAAHGQRPRF